MTVVSAHKTDTGCARERNEDYVWVDEQAGLFIVADGLGGHEAGDAVSRDGARTRLPSGNAPCGAVMTGSEP